MSENSVVVGSAHEPVAHRAGWFSAMLMRSEPLRGYTLLSPTLLVMAAGICIPFLILITMSFWTQVVFDFDTTLTTANYNKAIEHPVYETLMTRSLLIAFICAVVTVILSYPMAYTWPSMSIGASCCGSS